MDNLLILYDAPIISVQLLIDGILIGSIFALSAYGMAMVWGVMNVINIAQGELVMLGGYVTVYLALVGVNPLFGVPVAAVVLYVVGWSLYRAVVFRVVDKDLFVSLLATFGLSILIQQLANEVFGSDIRSAKSGLGTIFLFDDMVTVSEIKLVALVLAVVLGATLFLILKRSRLGQAIRATAQNARAARIMGIDTDRVYATTFALNAAICGAAGSLIVMTWVIHPYQGLPYTIRSFMIVVVAGLGNLGGVIAAGIGLGAAEQFAGFILGTQFQLAFVFSLLVVILLWRSHRLGRKRERLS